MACSYIFCDAPDKLGKSTTCDLLVNSVIPKQPFCRASKVVLPNGDGPLGFIRSLVKDKNFECDQLARQLLHCCSHIDAYLSLGYGERVSYRGRKYRHYYVFDRGPLSSMVYGQALIKDPLNFQILRDINMNILYDLIDKEIIDDLIFVLMDKDKPYGDKDDSYYEGVTKFDQIRKLYKENFEQLKNLDLSKNKRVRFCSVKIDEGLSKEEVALKVWNTINQ